jgi:hypothetical protein
MTGRGAGFCQGNDAPGWTTAGRGGSGGFHRWRGRRSWLGRPAWRGWSVGDGPAPPVAADRAEMLARRADSLADELAAIRHELTQLQPSTPSEEQER